MLKNCSVYPSRNPCRWTGALTNRQKKKGKLTESKRERKREREKEWVREMKRGLPGEGRSLSNLSLSKINKLAICHKLYPFRHKILILSLTTVLFKPVFNGVNQKGFIIGGWKYDQVRSGYVSNRFHLEPQFQMFWRDSTKKEISFEMFWKKKETVNLSHKKKNLKYFD